MTELSAKHFLNRVGGHWGDLAYWDERNAAKYLKEMKLPYHRLQSSMDHVQGVNKAHMLTLLNVALEGNSLTVSCNKQKLDGFVDLESLGQAGVKYYSEHESDSFISGALIEYLNA